ncbi:MAG: hypothetical protein ACTHOD_13280 [Motilibacteraceae bacterium]
MDDPWGRDEPPAVAPEDLPPLPAELARLAALTGPVPYPDDPGWRPPTAEDLPEVRALVEQGWQVLEGVPFFAALPALWPRPSRCWLPDRLPRITTSSWHSERVPPSRQRREISPLGEERRAESWAEWCWYCAEAGLPAPPPDRIWLVRSPWPQVGVELVLWLLVRRADERGLLLDHTALAEAAREMFIWDEDHLLAWWSGREADAAARWRAAGRTGTDDLAPFIMNGLGPEEVARLTARGLDEPTAARWLTVAPPAPEQPDRVEAVLAWHDLGLRPEDVEQVDTSWLTPESVRAWLATGFTLADAALLALVPLADAEAFRAAGFDVEETWLLRGADPLLTPVEALAFDAAGIAPQDRVRWVEAGFDAGAARAWTDVGVLPNEARVWRAQGLSPADAAGTGRPLPGVERRLERLRHRPGGPHLRRAGPPGHPRADRAGVRRARAALAAARAAR